MTTIEFVRENGGRRMNKQQWNELKETIIEMRDNEGTGTQQEVCKFLANYMDVLEKQMKEPVLDKIIAEIESCREDAEPHLCDYRHHRNEGLEMALDIIDKYKAESEEKA